MSELPLAGSAGPPTGRDLVRRADDGPARVLRIDPGDGATGVLRDAIVVACLSHPADAGSVSDETLRVRDARGVVPGSVRLDPAGLALVWQPKRPLTPGEPHCAEARGMRDRCGRPFAPCSTRFTPCALTAEDLAGG